MTLRTALAIAELRSDDPAAVRASFDVESAARAADIPDFPPLCLYEHEAALRQPWPGQRAIHALAYLDGEPAGKLAVELPQLDNLQNSDVQLCVAPAFRRRGVGRALFEHALDILRDEGRTTVVGMSVQSLPGGPPRDEAGTAFAHAFGMHNALRDIRSRLDLTAVPESSHDALLAGARERSAGYHVVRWNNLTPDEYVEDIASLDSQFLDETPMGDLTWEAERVDAERVRGADATREAYGIRSYQTGVVHTGTGRLVAWTAVVVKRGVPEHAWQHITLVHPGHRGHRLGMLAKITNLRFLRANEQAVQAIDTWNAAVNQHMIAINEAMGFRAVDAWANWQRTV